MKFHKICKHQHFSFFLFSMSNRRKVLRCVNYFTKRIIILILLMNTYIFNLFEDEFDNDI